MGINVEETQKGKRKNREPPEREKRKTWLEDLDNLKEEIRRQQSGE